MKRSDLKVGDYVSTTLSKWIDSGFTYPHKVERIYTYEIGGDFEHDVAVLLFDDNQLKEWHCNIEYLIIDKPAIRAKNLDELLNDQDVL